MKRDSSTADKGLTILTIRSYTFVCIDVEFESRNMVAVTRLGPELWKRPLNGTENGASAMIADI